MRLERTEAAERQLEDGGPHLGADAEALGASTSQEPVETERRAGKCLAMRSWTPTGSPSTTTASVSAQSSTDQFARLAHHHFNDSCSRRGEDTSVQATRNGWRPGSWMPSDGIAASTARSSSLG